MKVMHNPPLDVRVKVEKHLEKDGKWLVHLAYDSATTNERRFYIGISYTPRNSNEGSGYPFNRYDVVIYDNETDGFEYYSSYLDYENALIKMGQIIRKATHENQ